MPIVTGQISKNIQRDLQKLPKLEHLSRIRIKTIFGIIEYDNPNYIGDKDKK